MVRILAVADEVDECLVGHRLEQLRPDLVVGAGDLPWDYLEAIASSVDAPVVFVPGNHDPEVVRSRLSRSGLHLDSGMPCEAPRPVGAVNIDGAVVDVAGVRIAGLGGCVRYRPGPNMYSQREYSWRARRLASKVRRLRRRSPGDLDILLTHAPPLGLGDGDDRPHVGIEAVHGLIADFSPTWVLHGHIHPYGQVMPDRRVERTTIRNVIPMRAFELNPRQVLYAV